MRGLHREPIHHKRCFARSIQHVKRPYNCNRIHYNPRQKTVASSGIGDIIGLIAFSSLPFLGVQALADSKYGKQLLENLEQEKVSLKKQSIAIEKERAAVRSKSKWFGSQRPLYLPRSLFKTTPPSWLDGTLPGDYGFDPLSLGKNPEKLDRYVELEILHARWAMLGLLGAIIPEALQLSGIASFLEPVWWKVGAAKLSSGEDLNYLGISGLRVAGGQGIAVIAVCQALLMFGPEYARACGIEALEPLGVYLPGDKNYPGGWLFDPFGLSKDANRYEEMRVKEIKNGRLAMVAWLGFFASAVVSKEEGPLEILISFLNNNVYIG